MRHLCNACVQTLFALAVATQSVSAQVISRTERQLVPTPTGAADARFGFGCAMNRSSAAVGLPGENAVAIFNRNTSGAWEFSTQLISSDLGANDDFGLALSMDHDTLVVGAPSAGGTGAVYVFA